MDDPIKAVCEDFGIPPLDEGLEEGPPPIPVDMARLRAFHQGNLGRTEVEEITFLIANYREWYDADVKLLIEGAESRCGGGDGLAEDKDGDARESGGMRPSASRPSASRGNRIQVLAVAASLVVAVFSLSWAVWSYQQERRTSEQLAMVDSELQQARLDLGIIQKERLLRELPSSTSEMWGGDVSGEILQVRVPKFRGDPEITDEAREKASAAQETLQKVVESGDASGKAQLELAAVYITVRRLEDAAEQLEKAREILGDDPAVENAKALWLIAKGDRESEDKAQQLLRASTAKRPDFVPGWYNLALFLQRTGQFEESEVAWQEFLERESRPAYRKAAELHLKDLRSSFRGN